MFIEDKDFELFATESEYVIQFDNIPDIIKEPLTCSNKVDILPDADIKKLHGLKTSAGFGRIDCANGWSFRYLGKIKAQLSDMGQSSVLVLFDVYHNGEKINKPKHNQDLFEQGLKYYYPCYAFEENIYDEKSKKYKNYLFFSNSSYGAGRVVETDVVELIEKTAI